MLIDAVLALILAFSIIMMVTVMMHVVSGVPWVPSRKRTISLMLKMAQLKRGQRVYDLGCGDARLLIRAEKEYGIHGVGYENAPLALLVGFLNKWIHRSNVKIRAKNLMNADIKNADRILTYLGPELNKKLIPKFLKECKPGTLIISNTFRMHDLTPLHEIPKNREQKTNSVYVYKIPSRKK